MEAVKEAFRRTVDAAGPTRLPPPDVNDVLSTARFLLHCRIKRVYATVERISDRDGAAQPVVLLKAELSFRGPAYAPQRRTVVIGMKPVLEQLLFAAPMHPDWAAALTPELLPEVSGRAKELDDLLQTHVEAFKGDPAARESVEKKVAAVYEEARSKSAQELANQFRLLLKQGWTEADVLKVWKEAVCSEVIES